MSELTIQLIVFLFPLAYSPGPGNMFFAANGARFGFCSTLSASLGYHLATWVVTMAIGSGFGWADESFPHLLTVVKYAGSAYVFYLAWLLFRAGVVVDDVEPRAAGFLDGALLLILNPKAYLIISLLFTQFLSRTNEHYFLLVCFISTVFTINNFIAFSIWTYLGDKLLAIFGGDRSASYMNAFFGIILACVAVWMLLY